MGVPDKRDIQNVLGTTDLGRNDALPQHHKQHFAAVQILPFYSIILN